MEIQTEKNNTHFSLTLTFVSFCKVRELCVKKCHKFAGTRFRLVPPLRQGQLKLFDLKSSLINSPAAVNMQLLFLDYTYIYI